MTDSLDTILRMLSDGTACLSTDDTCDTDEDDTWYLSLDEAYTKDFLDLVDDYVKDEPSNAIMLLRNISSDNDGPLYRELYSIALGGDTADLFSMLYYGLVDKDGITFADMFKSKFSHPWTAYNLIHLGLICKGDRYYDMVSRMAEGFQR